MKTLSEFVNEGLLKIDKLAVISNDQRASVIDGMRSSMEFKDIVGIATKAKDFVVGDYMSADEAGKNSPEISQIIDIQNRKFTVKTVAMADKRFRHQVGSIISFVVQPNETLAKIDAKLLE